MDYQARNVGQDFSRKANNTPGSRFQNPAASSTVVPPARELSAPAAWKSQLQEIEKRLAAQPGSVALLFLRGRILEQMGRNLEARNTYMKVLGLEPSHLGALNSLGNLLFAAGNNLAALRLYARAVARHPDDLMSRMNLATILMQSGELEKARGHCEHAVKIDPNCQTAHARLAVLFAALGNAERAAWHRRAAYQGRCVFPVAHRGEQPLITLLQLVSFPGGNSPITRFLSDRVFQIYIAAAEFFDSATTLPPHQLVVNAIGDADLAARALAGAQSLLAHTTAPVLNPPAAVLETGRCAIARRLAGIPGVISPNAVTLPRGLLAAPDARSTLTRHGFEFPLLVRSPGFHGGQHFLRVESFAGLRAALEKLPGPDLTVIQYLDASGSGGKTRKYRVMMIGGQLYPLHAAISSHWKVHYFSAEMAQNPEHRAEEAEFLENMAGVLGPRALAALEAIRKILGLDYAGIDFGLNQEGEILVFEANATMVVIPPEKDRLWDYRRPAVERICTAVGQMLMDRAGVGPVPAALGRQLVSRHFQELLGRPLYLRSSTVVDHLKT
jgi:tetratricopeptide (TPR) repeat protein